MIFFNSSSQIPSNHRFRPAMARCSGDLLPPSPPAEKAAACQYEAGSVEGVATGEQRAQHVDEHDLARVLAEMILVEPRHLLPLVDFKALRHQRAERMGRKRVDALGDLERRKPQVGHLAERAAAQKPAGLKKAQAVAVARFEEIGAVAIVRLLRNLLARSLIGPVLCEKPAEDT